MPEYWTVSIADCSHAAYLDPTITSTLRFTPSQPQGPKSTRSYQYHGRRGATYQNPCTAAGSLWWCSVVPSV
ncbi:hypothetical protein ACOMHN_063467 [Nucella lapillus]